MQAPLRVWLLPSTMTDQWADALRSAANASGAPPLEFLRDAPMSADTVDDLVIVAGPSADVISVLAQREPDASWRTVVDAAARLLTLASTLATRGATVLHSGVHQHPLLGEVRIEAPTVPRTTSPLAFFDSLPVQPGAQAVWTSDVFGFTRGKEPEGGSPRFEVTGRGRIAVHGPYFELPAGRWRSTCRFGVDPEQGSVSFRFDWGPALDPVSAVVEIDKPGWYEITLENDWPDAATSEHRIWVARGAFQGVFEFVQCRIERVSG